MTAVHTLVERAKDFLQRAWNSQTVEDTFWIGASAAVNAGLGALASALYARFLGVEDFGVLTLIVSLMSMMIALADLGISGSLVRFASESIARGDQGRLRSVVVIALRAKLLLSAIVLAGALALLNPIVTAVFKHVDARITSSFLLSLLGVLAGMAGGMFPPLYQSFKRFRVLAIITVAPQAIKVAVVAVAALIVSHLVLPFAIWVEIGAATVLFLICYRFSPFKEFGVRPVDRDLRRDMLSFNKWLALYYVLNLLGGRIDLFFVGGLTDAHALGLYGAASKMASMVIIITNSYLTVLLPELSSTLTGEAVRRKQRNSFLIVALFSTGILALALLADFFVMIVFGSQFEGAGIILRIMCIGLLFTVFSYPLNATLFMWNKSGVYPLMTGIALVALVLGNAFLVPRFGAVGAAMAYSIAGFVGFLVSTVVYFINVRKRSG